MQVPLVRESLIATADRRLEPQGSRASPAAAFWGAFLESKQAADSPRDASASQTALAFRATSGWRETCATRDPHCHSKAPFPHRTLFRQRWGNPDTAPDCARLIKLNKTVYLPVLHPLGHQTLLFYRYQPNQPMPLNRYGIPEPEWRRQRAARAWSLPLVFTPLVAFDSQGNRIGMGGGYYDRTFDRSRCRVKHTHLTGLAYQFQEVGLLKAEPWDTPLAAIVTDGGYRCFGAASGSGKVC